MKGRSSKPQAIKKLQGNPGKRKNVESIVETPTELKENSEQKFFFSDPWKPAAWLPEGAKKIWMEQLPIALRETKLQQSSLQVFATYCDALHRLQKFTGLIESQGATYMTASGYVRKRPEVEMRDAAARDLRIYASELNLTPKSWINSMGTFSGRQLDMFMNGGRIASEPQPSAPLVKTADALDAFLGAKPTMQ